MLPVVSALLFVAVMLADARWWLLPCSAQALIICTTVCFMRFVGTVLENQGGAHRRQWVCMYCVDPVLKCLPCFPLVRFLSHYVHVWLSDWCRELVDRGLTLGWAPITAMVAHKVVHWVRQVSLPCPFEQHCRDSWYKASVKARILRWINLSQPRL